MTVVTAGHLSTCPRMLKAADAFADAGYEVRVVCTRHEPWATATDAAVVATRRWRADVVDYRRGSGLTYWRSGARYHAARAIAARVRGDRLPFGVAARAFGRVHSELALLAAATPADLLYGGTSGALAATAQAADRLRAPFALDLEDFHSGEASGADADLTPALATRVERALLKRAAFLTTSSEAIADAYRDRYGVSAAVVTNTFPLPHQTPTFARNGAGGLRLYWFSQTIGPGRGLEDAVAAMGRAAIPGELHLRGRPLNGYVEHLRAQSAAAAPTLRIVHHDPAPPDDMIALARGYDVGLALEQMDVLNRQLCLTNKAFIYIAAGVAVALTDTPGQHALGVDLGAGAAVVPPGDVDALAAAFRRWASDPSSLERAKRAAWDAAARRWHWEDAAERGALYRLVEGVVGPGEGSPE